MKNRNLFVPFKPRFMEFFPHAFGAYPQEGTIFHHEEEFYLHFTKLYKKIHGQDILQVVDGHCYYGEVVLEDNQFIHLCPYLGRIDVCELKVSYLPDSVNRILEYTSFTKTCQLFSLYMMTHETCINELYRWIKNRTSNSVIVNLSVPRHKIKLNIGDYSQP